MISMAQMACLGFVITYAGLSCGSAVQLLCPIVFLDVGGVCAFGGYARALAGDQSFPSLVQTS